MQANEAELIRSVCCGEREAFYDLVRPYERLIYATAISVVKNPADAEEVAQEAVLKALSNLSSFRAESKFSTWLVQITYNEAKLKLRRARAHLYESIDAPIKVKREIFGRETMPTGGLYLPNCWKKTRYGKLYRMQSVRWTGLTERYWFLGTSSI